MSFNRIIKKKTIGKIILGTKNLAISAATETEAWRRSESAAEGIAESLKTAVEASPEKIPEWAVEVIVREGSHESENDAVTHFTAVATDESGLKIVTVHIPIPKKLSS
ncbi:hypothetical protein PVAG01_10518 [Phlyctema vagabunda]|uniref:Uncharacterized protein n=1 Tax=Phlyctema vagabunda TaxID=108571 RepID=A0ABR4P2H4_9HELO